MTDKAKLRTDVPISLHPDSLLNLARPLDVKDTLGQRVIAAGREALSALYGTYGSMNDAHRALHAQADAAERRGARREQRMVRGRLQRVHGRERELADAAANAFQSTAMTVDRRVKELTGYRDALSKRVSEALDNPARKTPEGLALATEVRGHIKSLPEAERMRFVHDAIEAGDRATVAAVLHAQPFLSGLTDKTMATMRDAAARKFAPVDHDQLEATESVIARVQQAGGALSARFADIHSLADETAGAADDSLASLREGK